MIIKPLGSRVFIIPDEPITQTKSGILLPESASGVPTTGTVHVLKEREACSECGQTATEIKPGDKVMYSKYGGTDAEIDDVEYKIISEDQIYAILI